jgi:hypothetical protein
MTQPDRFEYNYPGDWLIEKAAIYYGNKRRQASRIMTFLMLQAVRSRKVDSKKKRVQSAKTTAAQLSNELVVKIAMLAYPPSERITPEEVAQKEARDAAI